MGKIFRLNVTVSYFEGTNINRYRKPILDIFKSFAWLYHLDYAISINHDFGLESGEADLVYLRSTDKTEISKKELDKVIYDVFRYGPSLLWEGVDVCSYTKLYRTSRFRTSFIDLCIIPMWSSIAGIK